MKEDQETKFELLNQGCIRHNKPYTLTKTVTHSTDDIATIETCTMYYCEECLKEHNLSCEDGVIKINGDEGVGVLEAFFEETI